MISIDWIESLSRQKIWKYRRKFAYSSPKFALFYASYFMDIYRNIEYSDEQEKIPIRPKIEIVILR